MAARPRWTIRDLVALPVLVALVVLAGLDAWEHIVRTGLRSQEQSHILLAIPVACLLMWVRRRRLRYCPREGMFFGPLLILGGYALSSAGFRFGIDIAWHLGAIVMVIGAIVSVSGVRVLRAMAPAAIALLFLLPIPGRIRQAIAMPLQEISASVGLFFLDVFGVAAERMGNVLIVNGQQVAVAEACNGMRMVTALLLVTFAFIFMTPMRQSVRLVFLLASPLLAIGVNLLRIMPIALVYGYTDLDTADLLHDLSGWLALVVALIVLWGLLHLLQWLDIPVDNVSVRET